MRNLAIGLKIKGRGGSHGGQGRMPPPLLQQPKVCLPTQKLTGNDGSHTSAIDRDDPEFSRF